MAEYVLRSYERVTVERWGGGKSTIVRGAAVHSFQASDDREAIRFVQDAFADLVADAYLVVLHNGVSEEVWAKWPG